MQELQLYINGERADLFNDEMVTITSSIQNVRDIASIFTDFSQQFSLPASKTNNKIFKYFYEASLVNGFDGRYKADAEIQLNYLPFKTGKIKLQEVTMQEGRPHTYKVVFYGSLVSLKDLLGEDLLSDMDLSAYDATYNDVSVINAMQSGIDKNGITDAIIAPLISNGIIDYTNRMRFNQADLRWYNIIYSIRIHCIIQAIQDHYGLQFSDDFFNDTNPAYWDLYMWLQRDKLLAIGAGGDTKYYDNIDQYTTTAWYGLRTTNGSSLIFINDVFTGAADWYKFNLTFNVSSASDTFSVRLKKVSGDVIEEWANLTGTTSYSLNCLTPLTQNTNYFYEVEFTNPFSMINTSTLYVQRRDYANNIDTTTISLFNQSFNPLPNFIVADQIPNIKVIDFLTGIFKMFNLTAYEENGIIVVKTLDAFYQAGGTKDLTKHIDITSSSVKPVPLYKEIQFKYDGLSSMITKQHEEIANQGWGTEKYTSGESIEGDVYSVTLPFEHMKYEKLFSTSYNAYMPFQVGAMVELSSSNPTDYFSPILGKPLLHYAINVDTTGYDVPIRDSAFNLVQLSSVYCPSNSLSFTQDNGNINFRAELNEYSFAQYNQTLFEVYYKTYISSLFDSQARLYQFRAILPISYLMNYKLNDKLIIFGNTYLINQIQINLQTGEANMELKNVV